LLLIVGFAYNTKVYIGLKQTPISLTYRVIPSSLDRVARIANLVEEIEAIVVREFPLEKK
jgi:hypothetical protein